jgi:hypothetical protein
MPLNFLEVFSFPRSGNGILSNSEGISHSVGDGKVSTFQASDRSCSAVEHEPLILVLRMVILDSQKVLVCSDVLSSNKSPVACKSRLYLELNAIGNRLSRVLNTLLVDGPGMSELIATVPEAGPPIVRIVVSCNFEALATVVSEVSPASRPEGNLLVVVVLEGSNDSNGAIFETLVHLARNSLIFVRP